MILDELRTNDSRGLDRLLAPLLLPAPAVPSPDTPRFCRNLLSSAVSTCAGSRYRRDREVAVVVVPGAPVAFVVAGLMGSGASSALWLGLLASVDLVEACTGSKKRRDRETCLLTRVVAGLMGSVASTLTSSLAIFVVVVGCVVIVVVAVTLTGTLTLVGSLKSLLLEWDGEVALGGTPAVVVAVVTSDDGAVLILAGSL